MDQINVFSSHRSIDPIQQTKTEWIDEILIEDSNDCEMFVNNYSSSESIDDDPNSYICNQFNENVGTDQYSRVEIIRMDAGEDEIVKEEYQFNEKYDVVEMDQIVYVNPQSNENLGRLTKEIFTKASPSAENQENVNFISNDSEIGTDRSKIPQHTITHNALNPHLSNEPKSNMEENAYEIINAADQLLKLYDFESEKRKIDTLSNADQSPPQASNDSVHTMILIEESSDSDVDSVVMIDLTLDHEEIDQKIAYVIESSDHEADQKQPKKQKQKRKATKISKKRNKKQKLATGSNEMKTHKCVLCQYSTPIKAHFVRHNLTHSDKNRKYKCKICTKRFLQSQTLAQHLKIHEREETVFRCSNCRREFFREKSWKSHENKCKNGLRQYECYVCREIVFNKDHLLKHIGRSHTGKMNNCPKCKKQFASKLGLTHHMKKHAESFAFRCKVCHQVFSRQDKWIFHEIRCKLKQYKCDTCDRDFVNKNHFVYHMQKHNGQTFNCSKCSREFRSAIGCKTHKCY